MYELRDCGFVTMDWLPKTFCKCFHQQHFALGKLMACQIVMGNCRQSLMSIVLISIASALQFLLYFLVLLQCMVLKQIFVSHLILLSETVQVQGNEMKSEWFGVLQKSFN